MLSPLPPPSALEAWSLFTRLGDSELLLPFVPLVAMWLWLGARQGPLARRWLGSLGLAALITAITKIAFFGWQIGIARWDFTGVSGHAMFACASYPMFLWAVFMNRPRRWQLAGVAMGALLGLLIAYSRLPVQAHSVSEVIVGAALGLAVSASCLPLQRQGPALPLWAPGLAAALLGLMVVVAPPSRTGTVIEALSARLAGRSQVFTRADLHRPRVEARVRL